MTGEQPKPGSGPGADPDSGFLPKTRSGRIGHLLFWVALFYALAWGIAKVCEWLSP